jgi:hypothetical protein
MGDIHVPIEPGTKFGKLTIITRVDNINYRVYYLCRCDCGREITTRITSLRSRAIPTCPSCAATKVSTSTEYLKMTSGQKYLHATYVNSAKIRGFLFDLTLTQFIGLTSDVCHYCGIPPQQLKSSNGEPPYIYNGIDRIDNNIGYVINNCVTCCKICNYAKRTMSYNEWMSYIKRLIDRQTKKTKPRAITQENVYQSQIELN